MGLLLKLNFGKPFIGLNGISMEMDLLKLKSKFEI